MHDNRKIEFSADGEQIIFQPGVWMKWGQTFIQAIWVIGVGVLLYWSGPSIIRYFQDGQITGAMRQLERFSLSPRGVFISVILWCLFLIWWGIGGLYEVLKIQLQQDRFFLRSDSLTVHRRRIGSRKFVFPVHERLALRLRPLDGALEAMTDHGSHVLTSTGTWEDRNWLLEVLQKRYHAGMELPAVTESSRERVATYMVERRTDGSVLITSSGLATVGCASIAAVLCVSLISVAVWLFTKGSGAGVIPLMGCFAIGFAGLGALNRRTVEVSRGRLRVQWSSPVSKVLRKFVSPQSMMLRTQFGEGQYEAESGTLSLKVSKQKKSTPNFSIVLLRDPVSDEEGDVPEDRTGVQEEDLEFADDARMEDLVLDVHGADARYSAEHLLRLLAETTGFPIG